ncbi:hypothetical protein HY498_02230 [Candidatus Woesearchaeota archaeon]|nr:hypothetical protein [Candidatus Woesearchaeota archaeon]
MRTTTIGNPPLGIYKATDIHLGQAYYLTLLDIAARYKEKFNGNHIIFPAYSFNVYGKRGEKLAPSDLEEKDFLTFMEGYAKDYISKTKLRESLNLLSNELLIDNDPIIIEGVKSDFLSLHNKGYVIENQGVFYLDCNKIKNNFDLKGLLQNIKVYPDRILGDLERLIDFNTNRLHPITKSTRYSIKNPIKEGQNIGPLFTLANLWDHKYPNSNYTIAGSNRNLANYIFLRYLSRIALTGFPGINEILVWPQIKPEGGLEEWDLKLITNLSEDADALRYAFASVSLKKPSIPFEKYKLKAGRRFVNCIRETARAINFVHKDKIHIDGFIPQEYKRRMNSYNFQGSIAFLEEELKRIKSNNHINEQINMFKNFIEIAEPFIPATVQAIKLNKEGF